MIPACLRAPICPLRPWPDSSRTRRFRPSARASQFRCSAGHVGRRHDPDGIPALGDRVEDVRSPDDAQSREVVFLARPSFRVVRVKRTSHADAAERFVRGEGTYDSVLRTLDRDGGETDVRGSRHRPTAVPLFGKRPGQAPSLLDGKTAARGQCFRARGRAHGGFVPPAGHLESGAAGRVRATGRRGRSSG